jgi:hypothetical protein
VVLSPRANYTDWATATCWRNLLPTFADRGVSRGQRGGSPAASLPYKLKNPTCSYFFVWSFYLYLAKSPHHEAPHYEVFSTLPSLHPSSVQIFSSAPLSQTPSVYKRFEGLTMKNDVFWGVTLCGACKNRRFGGMYPLHDQGSKNLWARNKVSSN